MKQSEKFSAIREIADDVCNDSASNEQIQQLEQLLRGNSQAQQFYYEYISMHNHLKSAADRNMEVVYRRMTEEVIVRPHADGVIGRHTDLKSIPEPFARRYKHQLWIIGVLTLLLALAIFQVINHTNAAFSAKVKQGYVSIVGKGTIDHNTLYQGEYKAEQDAIVELTNGDTFELSADSVIKFISNTEIELKAGKLSIQAVSGNNIEVNSSNYSLHSNGTQLALDLTQAHPKVTSGKSTVLIAKRWRPKHFWSFDGSSDQIIDSAGNAFGIPAKGVTRTKGLLGAGAAYFDDTADARINVGTGGATVPATGSFSVIDGITLEVLIKPEYSGELNKVDEIFRKGHPGENLRFMLSFHHDHGKDYIRPKIDTHESLSFGLYLVGQGYHELKLPLDGQEGRPTLANLKNGQAYHIVASYNVETGLKSIYINGEQLASFQYPPGSKILSGGPGQAMIGNNPLESLWERYAFSGTIDEFAFYDFALPPYIISNHYKQIQQGNNYFGLRPSSKKLPEKIKINLPPETSVQLSALTGLPEAILEP